MRKQPALLEDIADAAPVRRHEDAAIRIDQQAAVDADAAAGIRSRQAGDQVDQGGLAGARAAEQRGDAVAAGEFCVERKVALGMKNCYIQRHPRTCFATRRARISEMISALAEIATAIRVSRRACASPTGTWVKT